MSKNTNLSFLTDYITADITNGRIGINTPSPAYSFDVTGIARTSTSTYLATASGNVGIGTTGADQKLVINQGATSTGQGIPATTGTTQNGILRLRPAVGVYGETLDFGMNVSSTYGWIQATNSGDLATNYALALNPNGGKVGIGTSSPGLNLAVQGLYGLPATSGAQGTGIFRVQDSASNIALDMGVIQNAGTWIQSGNKANSAVLPLALNPSGGNVGIGTTSPSYKLQVSGNGYFSSGLTVEGTAAATTLSATAAIVTNNVATFVVTNNYSFTPPNMLTASSTDSEMKMYMVWVWGANTATYGGIRVWMIAVNGGGTAYTVNTLLSRDVGAGTGLDLTRTSATQLTITSNNAAAIKWVSIMQLNTNT